MNTRSYKHEMLELFDDEEELDYEEFNREAGSEVEEKSEDVERPVEKIMKKGVVTCFI